MKVISLFTGAAGLDLGLEAAGFQIAGCVEVDEDARLTIQQNRPRWKLATPGDIHQHDPEELLESFTLGRGDVFALSAGPPCQPFSKYSYWVSGDTKRLDDPRSRTLSAYLNVAAVALPYVLILENVQGFCYRGKDEGATFLVRQLQRINRKHGTSYQPQFFHINAASYGVPQKRERIFMIAVRDGALFTLPPPTHDVVSNGTNGSGLLPLTTAWDAIGALDKSDWDRSLAVTGKWKDLLPTIPEGTNYKWHTPRGGGEPLFGWSTRYWSFLLKLAKSRPSWTLLAQPGSATGPFHWRNRKLSVEEMCRLQTFPQNYHVAGSYWSARAQVGNAVPSAIGELIGLEIRRQLLGEHPRRKLRLIPEHLDECPPPERVRRVPTKHLHMRGNHPAHPGPGKGPHARIRKALEATIEQ